MSLIYTNEQKELIAMVKEMAENEIKPYVQESDEKGECPRELFKCAFDMGLHMLEIPEEYGGTGLSYETTAMIFEELAKVDAGYAISFVTTFVALRNVILSGTKKQGKYFADVIGKGNFAGFALTEPNAGSDPAAMRGTAVKDGEDYILNATKTFITNGALASLIVGFFKTQKEAGHNGISAFIIDANSPGITIGKHENKMGLRLSNTTDVTFQDVRVPASNMIGAEGSGFKLALNALNLSRAFVATLAVGIMQRALDESVKYSKERKQFDKPLIKFQMVQQMLADMAIKTEASRVLVNNTMKLMDKGDLVRKEGSITKAFVSDCAQEVTSNAVQIFGGYGYSKEYPVEKLMRDCKVFQIFEGTNQIQRMTIASVLEKEYK
ncbi:acyl-CoA dehydrogenase family protein [Clostridium saccharobutylicum]|uniref:Acyl-CoA dehydrogenase MmgC n=1 Tax=Clostridium saccharobutylicum DSM 13864 TaxID=1345695 RepID=U5MRT5_CLOSA|nr:acyl-CoA dehydrogenase family protein [Clostridium saccharobutylicum]AGX43233.1 acyl-CoA dehydrogenase MmgC [Clostridium saccharobutylicum DSM 13864]AQR90534.1 acyl-CoA dehydrogenase [Clostridium saccharobutylicum]AQS00438.1 acyl-CoA dehydrogenase [Clostridium saccharobutylicum]AQS10087.1 acyl-CoA dehydrogenase [Clostridium saccharobutylicum]AQS14421.1 acyl-CoA dehydrogenase [Clostridium saccharobutylicum]